MKRSMVVLFSGLALAGSAWLGHVVWGQTAETKEETYTITKSKLEKYVKEQVDKAVAAEREKATHDKAATDEQVFNPQNWHKLVFNNAEWCGLHRSWPDAVPSLGTEARHARAEERCGDPAGVTGSKMISALGLFCRNSCGAPARGLGMETKKPRSQIL